LFDCGCAALVVALGVDCTTAGFRAAKDKAGATASRKTFKARLMGDLLCNVNPLFLLFNHKAKKKSFEEYEEKTTEVFKKNLEDFADRSQGFGPWKGCRQLRAISHRT
jgi:hypothetical protein